MQTSEYRLTKQEIRDAFYQARRLRPYKGKILIQGGICVVLLVLFIISTIFTPGEPSNYVLLAVLAVLLILVIVTPIQRERRAVAHAYDGAGDGTILSIEQDGQTLRIRVPGAGADWTVERGQIRQVIEGQTVVTVDLTDGRLLVAPVRAMDSAMKQALLALRPGAAGNGPQPQLAGTSADAMGHSGGPAENGGLTQAGDIEQTGDPAQEQSAAQDAAEQSGHAAVQSPAQGGQDGGQPEH